MPDLDHDYTYDQVGGFYTHDPSDLHWVIVSGPRIVALRLREDHNKHMFRPRAEVWVGDDSPTKEWGNTLANDTVEVPLFVKKLGREKYTYLGIHEILTDEATEAQLAHARQTVTHGRGVSRIVFLKKQ